jgi:hypothetical protein
MNKTFYRIWFARLLVGFVLFINIQSAVVFLTNPGKYAPAYGLFGIPGNAAIQGFGVLFLMWNIPYSFALVHPVNYKISLFEAALMQFIGLIGESFILGRLPTGYPTLQASITRFIIFDGLGFLALLLAVVVTRKK